MAQGVRKLLNCQYLSKYAASMSKNSPKWSMDGYKAFAFARKISNCPKFVTSGQLGEKIYQISLKLAPGLLKLQNRQYLSEYVSSMPQNPPKWSMNG